MLDHLTYTAPEPKVIAGAKGDWELVIGLEVHAQVASNAKLFSGASTAFGAEPNSNVSFVDAAMPGMLPVINEFCVEQAVRTGLGMNAAINLFSAFDRKNYFYPDLPQGYQISQLYHPIVGEGEIIVDMAPGIARRVRIERIHLEQDAGKSIHDMDPNLSFVDLNRTGVALMEIVSRPDIRGPEEAAAYVGKLRQIMRYLGTCDGNMQNGSLRADVNVSVCKPGAYERFRETGDHSVLGTRCEIKNMNSMRFIQQAVEYEARRQIAIIEDGGEVVQETRLYDPDKGETRSMRSKEDAHDYRYFPDPDLLPLEIEQGWVDGIAAAMPELPDAKKARFVRKFMLTEYQATVLTSEREVAEAFEKQVNSYVSRFIEASKQADVKCALGLRFASREAPQLSLTDNPEGVAHATNAYGAVESIANIIQSKVFALAKDRGISAQSILDKVDVAGLVNLLLTDVISSKIGQEVFAIMADEGGDPAGIVESRGMKQVTDLGAIESAVDEIIAANPAQVEKARANPKLAGWFVGQVLKATGGKANPAAVNELVAKKLGL